MKILLSAKTLFLLSFKLLLLLL